MTQLRFSLGGCYVSVTASCENIRYENIKLKSHFFGHVYSLTQPEFFNIGFIIISLRMFHSLSK